VYRYLVIVAATISSSSIAAQINFTPEITSYQSEGFVFQNVAFRTDDGASISFVAPTGWNARGGRAQATLIPPNSSAEATIQQLNAAIPLQFDAAVLKSLEQQVINALPPGSQSVTMLNQEENPVLIDRSLSLGFTVSYQSLGETFVRNVVFAGFPDCQLLIKFTAPKAEFESLHRAFLRSIASWHRVDPKPAAIAVQSTTAR
jgi:hypothetical protein